MKTVLLILAGMGLLLLLEGIAIFVLAIRKAIKQSKLVGGQDSKAPVKETIVTVLGQ